MPQLSELPESCSNQPLVLFLEKAFEVDKYIIKHAIVQNVLFQPVY